MDKAYALGVPLAGFSLQVPSRESRWQAFVTLIFSKCLEQDLRQGWIKASLSCLKEVSHLRGPAYVAHGAFTAAYFTSCAANALPHAHQARLMTSDTAMHAFQELMQMQARQRRLGCMSLTKRSTSGTAVFTWATEMSVRLVQRSGW